MRNRKQMIALVLLAAASVLAAAPSPRQTANVILVTTDGLRGQEVFAGAEERLLAKESGVEEPEALRRAFWRETPEARREALLPFLWTVVAREGQLYGNTARGSWARVTNGLNFSYPGYNGLLAGAADPRIDSNDKRPNPNVTVLEWLNGREGYRGRVAAFCSWEVFPFIINRERSGVTVNAGWDSVPDHGRGNGPEDWMSHGAKIPASQNIWIAVLGPDTPASGERANVGPVTQAQVAATVAALLGEDNRTGAPSSAPPIKGAVKELR